MIRIHATSIAVNGHGILLTGASGCGKSDLALRMMDRGAQLVSDDYTEVMIENDQLIARAPDTLAGMIEVRGLGIIRVEQIANAPVRLALALALDTPVPRLPLDYVNLKLLGIEIPLFAFAALEPSAPIKLERLLTHILEEHP